ncbi:hypothetical protein NM688_g7013 [Phlebia brevispora]|uniref:Uncharacterized protein n=1 Tax=Phlebia brevispora TaxID=194682 RepID=A0ACC1S9Z6_9APHY|nr:hypothetical protein NM688_g7013 [Phlebia brevispora]
MSMNMLPMRFDREMGSPTRLQDFVARVRNSRRTRYVIGGAAIACLVLLFLVTTGRGGYPKRPPGPWPMEGIDMHPDATFDNERFHRADRVKAMFVRAYSAYEKHAFPHDELLPLSNGYQDNFNGWAVSLVDSLDTMMLMGLDDITERATAHIAKLTFDENQNVQFFETVIRYLGGLLSAYTMSGKLVYLMRADDVGRRLMPAFNTPQGLPSFKVNIRTGQPVNGWAGNNAILSEIASCQMEYRYLAHLTGRPEYIRTADHITDHLRRTTQNGLFSLSFDLNTGEPSGDLYSAGARADSTYEYLLKNVAHDRQNRATVPRHVYT